MARMGLGAAVFLLLVGWPLRECRAVQLFIDKATVVANEALSVHTTWGCTPKSAGSGQFICVWQDLNPANGVIANEPHIEFESRLHAGDCAPAALPAGTANYNYCNSDVFLCAAVGYSNEGTTDVSLDEISFEVFKFQDGSNPMDPASTPPVRTYYIDAPDALKATNYNQVIPKPIDAIGVAGSGGYCVLFDGATNIQGEFGKTNGQYGFRVTAKTNQTGASGNIQITAQRAYPGGSTKDSNQVFVQQQPVKVDVTNVHFVRSSATTVGQITAVYAEPYNIAYRLSKDATMYININESSPPYGLLRRVVAGMPRAGEGGPNPNPPLLNGDSWNGRHENGGLMPAGVYLATLQAFTNDQYGPDLSVSTTRQIALDPLQITDIRVQPLLGGSTSLAVLTYMLTEPATVYIDIYPPNTKFCRADGLSLNDAANPALDRFPLVAGENRPKIFGAHSQAEACTSADTVAPIRTIREIKTARTPVISYWDGRDEQGNTVCTDGDYVFLVYASLPSQNGVSFPNGGADGDRRIWTTQAKSGLLPVLRGFVGMSQIAPGTTIMGSSPSVAGLNPFVFRYTLGREGIVGMRIFDYTGTRLIKTLVDNVVRPGLFPNQERWESPVDDGGQWVSSGTYIAQMTAADPLCPMKVSTVSVSFPVDTVRITDVETTPLLSGASDFATISYQLSQPMSVAWSIYPPGTNILNSATAWPPCGSLSPSGCAQVVDSQGQPVSPMIAFKGVRVGRMKITEYWDGRDGNGLAVPDGNYVFILAAQSTTTPKYFAPDRIFGNMTVARGFINFTTFRVDPDVPVLFNSSSTITLHPYTISYALSRQSSVTIQILNTSAAPQVMRTLFAGAVRQGGLLLEDVWDGRDDRGNFMPTGFYLVRAVADDVAAQLSAPSTAQVTISYDPLRIFDVAVSPLSRDSGGAQLYYQVSETMKVAVKIYRPGTVFDPAGNPSPPESASLVKRIVGVRPARTEIVETWDGTDLRLGISPDGNYKFKIVASTDINAIDTMTGNVLNPAVLSLDRPVDEIPVVRNASLNPKADFEHNTYIYPNPVSGESAHFVIYSPFQARAKLRIYTMSGGLVLDRDLGESAADNYVLPASDGFVWDRKNQAGRRVARGVYYCVIRLEETLGGKNVLQTVKKFLVK